MQAVLEELRRGNARGNDTAYAADDELDRDLPRPRSGKRKSRYPGAGRRSPEQNALSVRFPVSLFSTADSLSKRCIREHMKGLFHQDDWLKELVSEEDLANWRPGIEECCTAEQFKLHLKGTPCDPWNASATRVFTDDFLRSHEELYPDAWAVRRMVLKKTKAYIKSLIKYFRQNSRGDYLIQAAKQAKNRQERKANVSPLV
jgi:hypothetical protein